MKLKNPISVAEIAQLVGAQIVGDTSIHVEHLNDIYKVKRGSLIFVDDAKLYPQALYSSASAVLIDKQLDFPPNKALLIVDSPAEAYNMVAQKFSPYIAMTATLSPSAKIGKNTVIEANAVIGNDVTIGDNCIIRANTTICNGTTIGNNVIIHPNSVIGGDGFDFRIQPDGSYKRLHCVGRVVIEDFVEIGAGCTIDKGVSSNTVIGFGTKIDNQVHIGHGVEVGKHCYIAAQVGIAGKTILQDRVKIYGQAGLSESIIIGEDAVIMAQTGVSKSIPGGKTYFGSPATESKTRFRELIALRRLPDVLKQWDKEHGDLLPTGSDTDTDNDEA